MSKDRAYEGKLKKKKTTCKLGVRLKAKQLFLIATIIPTRASIINYVCSGGEQRVTEVSYLASSRAKTQTQIMSRYKDHALDYGAVLPLDKLIESVTIMPQDHLGDRMSMPWLLTPEHHLQQPTNYNQGNRLLKNTCTTSHSIASSESLACGEQENSFLNFYRKTQLGTRKQ